MTDIAVVDTQDGSHTLISGAFGVSYHSRYGAIRESMHVFLDAGLFPLLLEKKSLSIFEMGLGTGLNVLLTFLASREHHFKVSRYEAIEAFPLALEQVGALNYPAQLRLSPADREVFLQLHACPPEELQRLSADFYFCKKLTTLEAYVPSQQFDLIYYDAFAPSAQPDLWTSAALGKMYDALLPGGVLVTYCAKGEVKRSLRALGFEVESLPGPPGKREMIRASRQL